ncbi:MAG: alanine--glyoxylate aminotransferase family protein [Imperialibacter sp.]|uniref:pyridoxal-phosphate-dependent aminotransferase family protein n=1 Tax=Imperialibacter sp. TaxID=2038411 RepID=UPI0032EAFA74
MTYRFNPPHRVLMGPGPSDAHPRVLKAMSSPLIGHLDPEFVRMMDEVKSMVQQTLLTKNNLTFVVSAPGSAGMETCLVNLLEPGDECIICVNGVFGGRMVDIAERCGAKVHRIDTDWGKVTEVSQIKKVLDVCPKPKLVAIVHAETSTGAMQPLQEISDLVHNAGSLLVVDAVTSYTGAPLKVDEWGIDAIYSGSQKCLSAPPGLSPVSLSEAAVKVLDNRKTKVQSWFLDLTMVKNYWAGAKRAYHHTGPVSAIFALHEALNIVLEEGLEERWARHEVVHNYLKMKLEALGFKFVVDEQHRLPNLNAVYLPEGVDEAALRTRLLNDYNIEVGGGLGVFAGKIWRIGIMGESCTKNHVNMLVGALEEML